MEPTAQKDQISNLLKPEFVQFLIKKLKTGNLRGSHLNCLPGKNRNRFSLFDLDSVTNTSEPSFFKLLTENNNFSFTVDLPHISEEQYEKLASENAFKKSTSYTEFIKERVILCRRLNNVCYDLKNEVQEYGTKSFAFGFPSFVIADPKKPGKVLVAPLLIWYLDIKQNLTKSNNWTISKNEENPIVFNEVLFNYLNESHGVAFDDFKEIQEKILEDGKVDLDELNQLVQLFEKKINQGNSDAVIFDNSLSIEDYSSKEATIEQMNNKRFKIINNGSFAFYRTYKESIIQDTENLLKNLDSLQIEDATSYQEDTFSAISTDPSQTKLLESIGSEKNILIQGPPGTGKSQSLTAVLTNALKNQVKCLVVCEKKTAMEVIYTNLEMLGLNNLAVMIDDPIKDRNKVVELVRRKIDNPESVYSSTNYERSFTDDVKNHLHLRDKLKKHHTEKNKKILIDHIRKNLIGKLLSTEDIEVTLSLLNPDDYLFDTKEYQEIKAILEQFKVLSSFLITKDPLYLITYEFIEQGYATAKNNLVTNLTQLAENVTTISENSESVFNDFSNKLHATVTKSATEIIELIEKITKHYNSLSTQARKRLEYENLTVDFPTKILSNISQLNKEIMLFKNNTLVSILKIKNLLSTDNMLNQFEVKELENTNILTMFEELEKISKFCDKENITIKLDEYVNNYTFEDSMLIAHEGMKELSVLVNNYNSLLTNTKTNLNAFSINVNTKVKEIPILSTERIRLFNSLIERFDYLHDFYSTLKFISEQESKISAILISLLQLPRDEWMEIFEKWYIKNLIEKQRSKDILTNDQDIRNLSRLQHSVRSLYPKIIKSYWNSEANSAISKYTSQAIAIKSVYNLRGAAGKRRNSLRTILRYDFETFTDFFPIVLTNPSTVSSIFPLKLGLFDVVIFDEASQLRIEDTFASFLRGKIHIVSGDKHQMPPSSFFISDVDIVDDNDSVTLPEEMQDLQKILEKNHLYNLVSSESLLDFADQLHFKESYLDVHYRSKHPDLIEFSNKAFYKSRLVPTPPVLSEKPVISFHEVQGVYHSEDHTNPKECEQVIEIIKEEYANNPNLSIGVATLNLTQRNFILDKITELSSQNEQFAEMMGKLEENGFFVKNLENIQGDERDIILISTTFGLREDGTFIQNFGPLTKKNGYRLLNVIITRAREKLHLITSIPQDKYSQYNLHVEKEGNDGKAIFYAYLAYAKAVSEDNQNEKENILKTISKTLDYNPTVNIDLDLTESPFEEEVYQRMSNFIPTEYIHLQQKVGGFRLDLVVDTNTQGKKIAVECDGATYHQSEEDHYWDVFRQEYLEKFGYVFHRIWSENWFEDSAAETRKLYAFIKGNGGIVKDI